MPGLSDGITSPPICVVIDAASRSMFDASMTLKPAQGAVAPISAIMRLTASSTRAESRSAALSRRARRSVGPSAAHAGNAAAAASAAALASAADAAAARVATSAVIGFLRAYVCPEAAGVSTLLINRSAFSMGSPFQVSFFEAISSSTPCAIANARLAAGTPA